eukprot:CAMPEP_0183815438 /NCGR_PEP_ID=MMETSP0803_2-20130417/56920_1 /TAXON_ID=195967 /ORGANISM="Crustomastix stigmata, Strain CCMP3273" /LENGTH=120 /DNA_ID=CAMNT_0026060301 /DNA_START=26 /DNA_END=385 /DNA_ORIENTATION=-
MAGSGVPESRKAAALALSRVGASDTNSAKDIVDAGGIATLVQLAKASPEDAAVGMHTIAKLTGHGSTASEALVQAGGIQFLSGVVTREGVQPGVLVDAVSALADCAALSATACARITRSG